jgi:hypothetical protein
MIHELVPIVQINLTVLSICVQCKSISSYGQNLQNSTYKGETVFCILICIMGLVFFSHLIGNMQVGIAYV